MKKYEKPMMLMNEHRAAYKRNCCPMTSYGGCGKLVVSKVS